MRTNGFYLLRVCYNKGVSYRHLCLPETQSQAGYRESFVQEQGSCEPGEAGGSQLERMSVPCDWLGEHLQFTPVGPKLGEGAKLGSWELRSHPGHLGLVAEVVVGSLHCWCMLWVRVLCLSMIWLLSSVSLPTDLDACTTWSPGSREGLY